MSDKYQIIAYYEFKKMLELGTLDEIRERLLDAIRQNNINGTIIIADEGYNSTVCGLPKNIPGFINDLEKILDTKLTYKSSFSDIKVFRKQEVKIKPEIVTLKRPVDISKGENTHVKPQDWNAVISRPDVFLLDTRNFYEYLSGTFKGAVNPDTEKFSDLPDYVEKNLDPKVHKNIAMFCTGGIRCEKFAPYMKGLEFENVYQLEGGILKYLEEIPEKENMFEGECFVFDDRRTVDDKLDPAFGEDHSLRDVESARIDEKLSESE